MGETILKKNASDWQTVDCELYRKMINGSLAHTLCQAKKIKRRTKVLNSDLKKCTGLTTYAQYVAIKTDNLRSITDNDDTDDEPFSDDDYYCGLENNEPRSPSPAESLESFVSDFSKSDSSESASSESEHNYHFMADLDSMNLSKSKKTRKRKSLRTDPIVSKIAPKKNLPSTSGTKLRESKQSSKRWRVSKPEKSVAEKRFSTSEIKVETEGDESEKENFNRSTEKIIQVKTTENVKRNLTPLLNDLDDNAMEKSMDVEAERMDTSEMNIPIAQSTQIMDSDDGESSESEKAAKSKYSLSLIKNNLVKNVQPRDSGIDDDSQDNSSGNNANDDDCTQENIPDNVNIENDDDGTQENILDNVNNENDDDGTQENILDNVNSENDVGDTQENVPDNVNSEIDDFETKLDEKESSEHSEEETTLVIDEKNEEESEMNETLKTKSQPIIKCTEIVKSKYTIIRDESENDEPIVDENIGEKDTLTPETKRLRQLKRINLTSSSYDSDSSDDSDEPKNSEDNMIWVKEEIPPIRCAIDKLKSTKGIYFGSPFSQISDSSESDVANESEDEREEERKVESKKTDISDSLTTNLPTSDGSVRKSFKSQVEEQENLDLQDEKEKNGEIMEDLNNEVTSKSLGKPNENHGNSNQSQQRRTENSLTNNTPTEVESLQCVLSNLKKINRQIDDDCLFTNEIQNNSTNVIRDHSENEKNNSVHDFVEHTDEILPRPIELSEFIDRQGLVCNSDLSTITTKDIKNCNEEGEDEEMWIMEIPRSILTDSDLCGKKMVLKKKKLKIGDVTYQTLCRNNEPVSCIVRTGKKKKRYKTVNIKPVGSIVVRQETAMKKESTILNIKKNKKSAEVSANENVVPFPKNLKSRNPILALNDDDLSNRTTFDWEEKPVKSDKLKSDTIVVKKRNKKSTKVSAEENIIPFPKDLKSRNPILALNDDELSNRTTFDWEEKPVKSDKLESEEIVVKKRNRKSVKVSADENHPRIVPFLKNLKSKSPILAVKDDELANRTTFDWEEKPVKSNKLESETSVVKKRNRKSVKVSADENIVKFPKDLKSKNPILALIDDQLSNPTTLDWEEKPVKSDKLESETIVVKKRKRSDLNSTEMSAKRKTKKIRLSGTESHLKSSKKQIPGKIRPLGIVANKIRRKTKGVKTKKGQSPWHINNFISRSKKKTDFPLASDKTR